VEKNELSGTREDAKKGERKKKKMQTNRPNPLQKVGAME